jgi:hypothetical protein
MFFSGKIWQQIAKLAKFTLGKQTFPIFLSIFFAGKKNCLQCSEHVLANMYRGCVAWALGVSEHWWQTSSLGTLGFTIHSLLLAILHASLQVACNYT